MDDLSSRGSRGQGITPGCPAGSPAGSGTVGPGGAEPEGRAVAVIWRNRPFLVLWLARIVSVTGSMASMIAVPWWVLDVTGSARAMAAAGALVTVVLALVALPAGVWVDRLHRDRLFLALELARGAITATLAAALLGGRATVPLVFTLLAADAAAMALFTFAMILQPLGQLAGGALADRFPLPYIFTGVALAVVAEASLTRRWRHAPGSARPLPQLRGTAGGPRGGLPPVRHPDPVPLRVEPLPPARSR
ncbi:MAG TPA: hypothetical protein VIK99_05825 [Thermaerobacter sp.]